MFCFVFQFCVLKDGRAGEIAQCVRALAPQMWGPEFKSQTPTTIQAQLPVPVTLELGSDYRQIQALARQNGELLVQWYEWEEWNWGWAVDFMSKGFTQAKECKFHSRNHLMKKKKKVRYGGCTYNPRDGWMLWDNPLAYCKGLSTWIGLRNHWLAREEV